MQQTIGRKSLKVSNANIIQHSLKDWTCGKWFIWEKRNKMRKSRIFQSHSPFIVITSRKSSNISKISYKIILWENGIQISILTEDRDFIKIFYSCQDASCLFVHAKTDTRVTLDIVNESYQKARTDPKKKKLIVYQVYLEIHKNIMLQWCFLSRSLHKKKFNTRVLSVTSLQLIQKCN